MPQTDFIPQSPTAFVVWFTKFILHLQSLSAKYGLCPEKVDALLKDHEWVHYWAWMRSDAKEQEIHLKHLFEAAAGGEKSAPMHEVSEALGYVPDNLMPAIRERVCELVESIKSQTAVYTKEDGSLLGILTPEEAGWTEEDYTPDMKFEQLSEYCLGVDFRKYGMDAVRVEYRYINGDWRFGRFLTKSPDILRVPPRLSSGAEQVEIRAIFQKDKQNFGHWSPVYRMIIVP